ncbi:oxoglutarate dehydrogenase (succinyl-transferring), E1 component [Leptospira broomii serovar Hurstbridge str. 5399]|uniref:2-oxoglutarate dehydrogenase E1 component n=1 Tax=Leptospira broomii serovar Hurstbridge str. 5399 TaxID=1049789 RepID=T0EYV5_9LEPT|nr:2-oxoglutarate dehydrogenase E1 component [Leptospira broomii]EQA44040.1 oxoglutarate dehydrogenase (succinyl-transferring), E1 component [Leptospira broomii serovar Hurstbridge str. 5399]
MKIEQLMALYGENGVLLEELYEKFKKDPQSLDKEWALFFQEVETNGVYSGNGTNGASNGNGNGKGAVATSFTDAQAGTFREMGIINLLNAYRRQGHLAADLDPLGISKPNRKFIDAKLGNLTQADLDTVVDTNNASLGRAKLKDVIDWFEKTYCSTIGYEQYYLVNDEEREWLQKQVESVDFHAPLSKSIRLRLFEKLFQADHFETFLAKKYVGKKRFSLEGGESMIPMLDTIVEEAGHFKMDGLVIGMAHRGRLNVLVNVIEKPASLVFAEFEEKAEKGAVSYADVKYHLGYSNSKMTTAGKEVKLSLAFNPSHLEAVNPVVTGSVRARQEQYDDTDRSKYMPVTIHGDAAFAGQGVVAETINLMNLEGYTTGGTFHIVINNQIGFTTLPNESRSTLYATDLAKGYQIPIVHVNGDDPEAVYRVTKLGMEYRQKFKKDFIIDLICYRRLGHNETDEPAFTQPKMYAVIKGHLPTAQLYEKKLLADGDITKDEVDFIKNGSQQGLEDSFQRAKEQDIKMKVDTMRGVWARYSKDPLDSGTATSVLAEQRDRIVHAITTVPEGFTPNPKLVKLLQSRKEMAEGKIPLDWGMAEALSFGSILENGFRIRLSGQDSQRGTFSHRHAVLVDINSGEKYVGLNHISDKQAKAEIVNSSLSEFSVLGFEYGYSLSDPNALVIWEAQFGDFANNTQVIFDQFLSSSEVKWQRLSGLTILLPHGYEGQGPEHSSGRIERFLQLSADNNMQVANCTNAAQYFHLLRRQMLRNFRKPLIIFTPKSLLRFPGALSPIEDLLKGAFKEVLPDSGDLKADKVEKIVFSFGKVYYDLLKYREENKVQNTALIRVEQMYPFPNKEIEAILRTYKNAKTFVWCQEEPKNQGAWFFVRDRLEELLPSSSRLKYAGRKESPSPAAGHMKVHLQEQDQLVQDAFLY